MAEPATCGICPLCALLQARPEVAQHLLAAVRELVLAAQSLLDGNPDAAPEPDRGLERIEIS